MSRVPVEVLVALPAHDERDLVVACLQSVIRAADVAQQAGVVTRVRVAVALHRCADDTGDRVLSTLLDRPDLELVLLTVPEVLSVGEVRTRLIQSALVADPPLGDLTWIFNTDADTIVPPEWIVDTLQRADEQRADLVLGLADLGDWHVDDVTRAAYELIVDAGLIAGGHRHAYAANLAIRRTAFLQVGGFPASLHGEEHVLAAACRAADLTVISTLSPRVLTSARMPGRATLGLGALLARLADPTPAAPPLPVATVRFPT